jgi:predicted RNase H-like HicB family nuclease/predicted RNA binding protein YcfA (HicA-like mRNA interferase family)
MKIREAIALVERDGWRMVVQEGSHRQYKHPIKKGRVTIAGHPSMDLDPKTKYPETSGVEMKYAVLFEQTETGYSAHVPDLPGCIAAGSTLAETTELIRRAIGLHVAGMREDGEPIPEARTIAEYIVAA